MTQWQPASGQPGPMPSPPEYWLASDGNWYPPEQRPAPPPFPPYGPPVQPGPWDPPRIPYQTGPMVQARQTNGLAIASLICACAGIVPFLGIVGVILGLVFGFTAKGQIKRTGGVQEGSGLATAGIIISFVVIGAWAVLLVTLSLTASTCTDGTCSG